MLIGKKKRADWVLYMKMLPKQYYNKPMYLDFSSSV